jgi:hypothetical protein
MNQQFPSQRPPKFTQIWFGSKTSGNPAALIKNGFDPDLEPGLPDGLF